MLLYGDKPTDRRVSKTKHALKSCFLTLLDVKPVQRITVAELCRMTDLNRSTFYAHYPDIYVLLNELKSELLVDVDECQDAILANRTMSAEQITGYIFKFIARNRILLRYVLLLVPDPDFQDKLNQKVQTLFYAKLFQDHPDFAHIDRQELENALLFLSHGFYAIYRRWLSQDCKTSIDAMTHIALKLTTNCIQAFEQEVQSQK